MNIKQQLEVVLLLLLSVYGLDGPVGAAAQHSTSCICTPVNQCLNPRPNLSRPSSGVSIDSRCRDPMTVCCLRTNFQVPSRVATYQPECGRMFIQPTASSVFNNGKAKFGEFPWTAAIIENGMLRSGNPILVKCSGFLIHPRVVVTTATCVDRDVTARGITARLGEWNLATTSEELPHQDRQVDNIFIHPKYIFESLFFNIALLYLNKDVTLQRNIDTICLPKQTSIFTDAECFSSGWGDGIFGNSDNVILKKIPMQLVSKESCETSLRRTVLGPNFILGSTDLCAIGKNGADLCARDGGAALICPKEDGSARYTVAGSLGWGVGCGYYDRPAVFTLIPTVVNWIDHNVTNVFGTDARRFYT